MHIKETVGIDSVFPWDTEWGYAEFSNLEEIKEHTFDHAPLVGELIFPKSLKKIGKNFL